MSNTPLLMAVFFVLTFGSFNAIADDEKIPVLTIKDHQFSPNTVEVKAGERFKLKIVNEDTTSEEFESKTMIVEKFVGPKKNITVILGPLKSGSYEFFGDFHSSTAKGTLTAK